MMDCLFSSIEDRMNDILIWDVGHQAYGHKILTGRKDVFHTKHMRNLIGNAGIGHVRYPTAGSSSVAEAQPFYTNTPFGVSLAHNGNLNNTEEILDSLLEYDHRRINTSSDSEALLNLFAAEIQRSLNGRPGGIDALGSDDIFRAIERTHMRAEGSYSVVTCITGWGIVAFRDPNGIRPLCMGTRDNNGFLEYAFASESAALMTLGFNLERDVLPGEAIVIDRNGKVHSHQCSENSILSPCIFEFVYFARPDSIIDNISVYKSRLRMGEKLAEKIKLKWSIEDIDVVMPVPDTSRTAALQLANELDLKYREGFIKNRYIARTFIMPGQKQRKKSVRQKLSAIELEFKDKNVLLVDDSIVRGTTSQEIVQMARAAGAKKVFFASAAPPVRYPNVYGIDMASKNEFVAHNKTTLKSVMQLVQIG